MRNLESSLKFILSRLFVLNLRLDYQLQLENIFQYVTTSTKFNICANICDIWPMQTSFSNLCLANVCANTIYLLLNFHSRSCKARCSLIVQ